MKWKTKANKAIKAIKEDEFFTWSNPLVIIVFALVIIWIIEIVMK
ncbi:MAG: hypothetical protein PHW62_00615 [Candidatus Ratteibacteria bacterium]|nr:hypothetical protein [Candidatus Ratteibacteria bacterium]